MQTNKQTNKQDKNNIVTGGTGDYNYQTLHTRLLYIQIQRSRGNICIFHIKKIRNETNKKEITYDNLYFYFYFLCLPVSLVW